MTRTLALLLALTLPAAAQTPDHLVGVNDMITGPEHGTRNV